MLETLDRPITICPPDPRLSMPMGYTAMPTREHQKNLAAKFLPNLNPDGHIHTVSHRQFLKMLEIKGTVRVVGLKKFLEMIDASAAH